MVSQNRIHLVVAYAKRFVSRGYPAGGGQVEHVGLVGVSAVKGVAKVHYEARPKAFVGTLQKRLECLQKRFFVPAFV